MRCGALFRIAPFAVLLSCAVPADGAHACVELDDERIVRNFDIVALRREHAPLPDPRITKWLRPLRIHVVEEVPVGRPVREDLDRHMERLHRLTGLAMSRVGSEREANFLVVFTRRDRYRHHIERFLSPAQSHLVSRMERANCMGAFTNRKDTAEIIRGVTVIPVDSARMRGLLYRCIVEETTQLLGLPNDSDDVYPSIFNDRSRLHDLTWHDELLIRLLYHPEMRVGLRREEALAVARRLVPRLRSASPP